ncbi:MoaD/ThiS family protein [Nitratireductor sp. XY-223]|uniref:MoaD/ThiS family protein n=1 Tax=Nitratireductor sp. XY-223 TaxID=2561926 RepID=UPI0010A9C8B5|nr:MoaD/ThiS family protein [Nitratireductor sp. XY-223]
MSEHQALRNVPQVTVILCDPLRRLFPDAPARSLVNAASVGHMLDELDRRWPGMRDRLADTSPAVRPHISIFVDGVRAELDTPLPDRTDVYVLTAMSGG